MPPETVKIRMLNILQEIFLQEHRHFSFYFCCKVNLTGLERLILSPLFDKEMKSELEHMQAFADKLVSIGGKLAYDVPPFPTFTNPNEMMLYALQMEKEILQMYHKYYTDAKAYDEHFDDMSIVLLFEENIEDTTKDMEEIKKIYESMPVIR